MADGLPVVVVVGCSNLVSCSIVRQCAFKVKQYCRLSIYSFTVHSLDDLKELQHASREACRGTFGYVSWDVSNRCCDKLAVDVVLQLCIALMAVVTCCHMGKTSCASTPPAKWP
jgi:hypothetical protein